MTGCDNLAQGIFYRQYFRASDARYSAVGGGYRGASCLDLGDKMAINSVTNVGPRFTPLLSISGKLSDPCEQGVAT